MRTAVRPKLILAAMIIVLALIFALLIITRSSKSEEPADPHEGQVYIYDGQDWTWYTPLEGVDTTPFDENCFKTVSGHPTYSGKDYSVMLGIDVSEHQKLIRWSEVAASGIDFAYIRLGRRGTTEGGLFLDEYFSSNIISAKNAGLKVGIYFFSQAKTVTEAIEEAEYVISNLQPYGVDLPVVFDWEEDERTVDLDPDILNDCAVAFCETVKNAGYEPCVYFGRLTGYYAYDLQRLNDYKFWFTLPDMSWPSFYYDVDMWQYSFSGSVPGIDTETDLDMIFTPAAAQTAP